QDGTAELHPCGIFQGSADRHGSCVLVPETQIINRFFGRAAAVTGSYSNGKVVLIGPHPELPEDTQPFFLSALQHLTTRAPVAVDGRSLQHLTEIRQYELVDDT